MIKFLLVAVSCYSLMATGYLITQIDDAPALFDKVVLDSVECPQMDGMGVNVLGVGVSSRGTPDIECNARALAQLHLATGMTDNAKYIECKTATALREYANIDNCMNLATVGYQKVLDDVRAKDAACGGKPRWWKRKKRKLYRRCVSL